MDFSSFSPALVLLTVVSLALAPFVAVMVTSFTKIVVVLSLLRNALGLQQVPPNVVINGLAIVLSIYVMYPVILETHDAINASANGTTVAATQTPPAANATTATGAAPAAAPAGAAVPAAGNAAPAAAAATTAPAAAASSAPAANAAATAPAGAQPAAAAKRPAPTPSSVLGGKMDAARLLQLMDAGKEPLRKFLIKHSSDAERAFFLRSAQRLLPPNARADIGVDDFIVVIPAFTVSELTAAFQIGFLIFLPFLIIDLVVSNILLSLGMMMLSPTTVSLPFKLLLFVLIGGWAKLVHGLVLTYGG
ncbi:EscR/YscR/HrcR family type III secretion system export apparatus protein [Lysobacter yananisis]|uniref:EscR/YscR/HrcR family type III secretion system export apparatus protein n=1 Tax=Lysobacter yananisis TaxID=1003114 RepID=A0ABY9PCZ4_9GAMM|nr:EscR/YscR/HrcR family type III secretion system export apparatus protein [Lysobacter yananisis]WMT04739.1 EscR/YscR/HrcR family type III secretion system export apparatus protein [Lysobacter yananisis]